MFNSGNLSGLDPIPRGTFSIGNVLGWVYALAGLTAVGFIIVAGIKYSTAQGDPGKVKQAQKALTFAVVGLVIVILAAVITSFIIGSVEGAK